MTHTKLLPCPFCGNPVLDLDNLVDDDDYGVSCPHCDIQQISNYTRQEAISRWNKRASVTGYVPNTTALIFALGWQGGTVDEVANALHTAAECIVNADAEGMELLLRCAQGILNAWDKL
jgi:Lar family restriction alleviation protein